MASLQFWGLRIFLFHWLFPLFGILQAYGLHGSHSFILVPHLGLSSPFIVHVIEWQYLTCSPLLSGTVVGVFAFYLGATFSLLFWAPFRLVAHILRSPPISHPHFCRKTATPVPTLKPPTAN